MMKEVFFNIELVLVKGHKEPSRPYQQQPLQHLIVECNRKARRGRETIRTCPLLHDISKSTANKIN